MAVPEFQLDILVKGTSCLTSGGSRDAGLEEDGEKKGYIGEEMGGVRRRVLTVRRGWGGREG